MGQNKTIDGRVGDPSKSTRDGREKELQYERHLMIGGYENPVQTMPSGEGNFYFETSDPGAIDSFYAPDADRLLRHIYREVGAVDIVRMHGYTWSVEDSENIYGTIRAVTDYCHDGDENGKGGAESYILSRARKGCRDPAAEGTPGAETWQVAIVLLPREGVGEE